MRYQTTRNYEPEAPTMMEPFMQPFGPECYLPQESRAMRELAVAARIQKNVSSITELEVPIEMALGEIREHIVKLIGRHVLFPLTEAEVREAQPRPSQQRIIDQGALVAGQQDDADPIYAFEKAEPAQKVSAPRIISPDDAAHKLLASRFMIPVHRAFVWAFGTEGERWYAPGMTPVAIAERVAELCQSDDVTLADGDKYDSSISPVERAWEHSIYYALYHPSTHAELEVCLKKSHCCPVVFGGVVYEQLCGRGSGYADTTVGNTMWNMAKDYVAARTEPSVGGYRTPEESRRRCGIYMGDDSVSKKIGTDHLVTVGAKLGLVLEVEQKKFGEPGVNFISRFFGPNVWCGDASSTCDVPRICSKIHVAPKMAANSLQPRDKLAQRMLGLSLSDSNTPIIGPYACATMELFGRPSFVVQALSGYNALPEHSSQFPNENVGGWMEAYWTARCPNMLLDVVDGHLDACMRDPGLLLKSPLFFRPVPIVAPPEIVLDVPHTPVGNPFAAFETVRLDPEERVELREAVNAAAKAGAESIVNNNNATVPVVTTSLASGKCRDCAKTFLGPLLSKPQRARMESGEPFRCRICASEAKAKFEAAKPK